MMSAFQLSKTPNRMAETKHRENIQVFVRVRSLNAKEKTENAYSIIDCSGTQEITVRDVENRSKLKTFTYDKVFSQKSKQIDVYKDVMQSHIEEVLSGYNCTVFAYGQTGTGKTYTMEGERSSQTTNWQEDPNAGIIPRALNQIFDELQSKFSDFAIRVSYLELYNEELFDLLSPVDDTTKLRLFEDSSKKGSVIIKGLEEATVTNKNEVYKILEKGSAKRQTASTLMNAQSSRSHTIFSVTVHIHEEDYVRIGKLNLVDLAGSENIGRSGAVDKRAREAGNINQSLLTLGRVITCLVEGAPHIPYRESKLTRLLQDSLGGKTKTTIVATISPANSNVEETVSTLEYAHRAKNIQNKPEVNKVLTQKSILKEYNEQIERLKRDLKAVQDKTGITISEENYEHMIHQIGSQEKKLLEKMHQIKAMEEERDKQSRIMENFQTLLQEKQDELQSVNEVLIKTETVKKEITEQAKVLHEVVKVTSKHTELLHDKLDRKAKIDLQNANALAKYKSEFHKYFDKLENLHASFIEAFNTLSEEHEQFVSDQVEKDEEIKEGFYQNCAAIENKIDEVIKNVTTLLTENTNKSIDWASLLVEKLQELTDQENIGFRSFVEDNVVPLLTEIIAIKEKMTTDVLELEEINNDCVDTMEVDSEMKKDLLSQLRNDKVAVTNGIDAVGRELATLEAKQHELTRHNDEQMMKTNELMVDISHSMETNKQLYEDLLEINKKLDESEHNLIVTVNNFSSFVANKFASMYEMIENAQEGQKKEIEGIQQLCTAYEVQNDDGRSLLLNPSRGLAEKLKSFSNSQSEMISSNVEMISSFVSDGKSDLSKLAAGNEKTKELVDSLATNFHKFEGKLSSLKILDKKLADELVEMIEENNRSSKESSEKDIKHILESLDTFNSNLTKFFERKLRRLPEPSGDTPKREDLMKLAEEAGVEVDIDVFPNNANRLFQQIPSGKEKENVREAVSPKSNLSIPVPGTSSRVLEELNKN